MNDPMNPFGGQPSVPEGGVLNFGGRRRGKKAESAMELVNEFMQQQQHRPEATRDINQRLLQALGVLGRIAEGQLWKATPQEMNQHWAHLFLLLYGTCQLQNIDVEKIVKEHVAQLPSRPPPGRQRTRVRGLRL